MVKSKTFRLLGYFFAIMKIVFVLREAVKCTVNIGGIHDFTEVVTLIMAFLYIVFSILLILGILLLIEKLVLANRNFIIIANTLLIAFTSGKYVQMLRMRQQMEKGGIALIVVVVILIVVLIFELWLMNGVLRYVKNRNNGEV